MAWDDDDDDFDDDYEVEDYEADSDFDEEDDDVTLPCPYCGADIPEDAPRCPYCENYISAEDAPPAAKPWWLVAGVIACLAAMLWWLIF